MKETIEPTEELKGNLEKPIEPGGTHVNLCPE